MQVYVRGEASADARSAAGAAFALHCADTDAAAASPAEGAGASLVKVGAWPHLLTVGRTGASSAAEALALDAAVMEALAAHVAAASATSDPDPSNGRSFSASSGA